MTYEEHNRKWMRAKDLVSKHNEKLIKEWRAMERPFWKFWLPKPPSFEEQREIILQNWRDFEKLPMPNLMDYYPIHL